jgi:hypothetical protein
MEKPDPAARLRFGFVQRLVISSSSEWLSEIR